MMIVKYIYIISFLIRYFLKTLSFLYKYLNSEHAKELGNAIPEKPLLFMKPPSAYITEGSPITFPMGCKSLHHEIELGIVISSRCSQVDKANVMDHVGGYVLVSFILKFYLC